MDPIPVRGAPLEELQLHGVGPQGDDALHVLLHPVGHLAVRNLAGLLAAVDALGVGFAARRGQAPLHKALAVLDHHVAAVEEALGLADAGHHGAPHSVVGDAADLRRVDAQAHRLLLLDLRFGGVGRQLPHHLLHHALRDLPVPPATILGIAEEELQAERVLLDCNHGLALRLALASAAKRAVHQFAVALVDVDVFVDALL
mmetsp:Transcript_107122/g.298342  ORF Transcript_107122/g.298342 Transcript_107122/m.298342 type:complete len:201 (+) Transcript_107122:463-1065(+)